MPFAVAAHRTMVSFTQDALIALTQNGNLYPVAIEAVRNARTMNQPGG